MRRGFVEIDGTDHDDLQPAEWTAGMWAIREKEAQHGLRVEGRVFMRRDLVEVGPAT